MRWQRWRKRAPSDNDSSGRRRDPPPDLFSRRDAPVKQWLVFATENAIVIIDALALIIIVVGTVEAFFGGLRAMIWSPTGHDRRDIWLRYARWLVAGLTFQLAADIIETSITTEWQAVARLGAVAVIRTFLNYFLDRDLGEMRLRQREVGEPPPKSP
jgi:uncharacterized membrane protein